MFQIRVHGRGGQGVVTTAELLSIAAFLDGYEAQAFPSFGSERMGAPVMAFCRVSDTPIRLREPVSEPDAVILADATLLHHVDVFAGLAADGYVLINSTRSWTELGLADLAMQHRPERLHTIAAADLARRFTGRPVPNAPLLGAFAALTGVVSLSAVESALRERFAVEVADGIVGAARVAFEQMAAEVLQA